MNEQQIKLFQSKKSDNWATPKKLYSELNSEFNFDTHNVPSPSLHLIFHMHSGDEVLTKKSFLQYFYFLIF